MDTWRILLSNTPGANFPLEAQKIYLLHAQVQWLRCYADNRGGNTEALKSHREKTQDITLIFLIQVLVVRKTKRPIKVT